MMKQADSPGSLSAQLQSFQLHPLRRAILDAARYRRTRKNVAGCVFAATLIGLNVPAYAQSLNLSDLDGDNGFLIEGEAYYDTSGSSVSGVGDINGDGVAEIAISGFRRTDGHLRLFIVDSKTGKLLGTIDV